MDEAMDTFVHSLPHAANNDYFIMKIKNWEKKYLTYGGPLLPLFLPSNNKDPKYFFVCHSEEIYFLFSHLHIKIVEMLKISADRI